jgi:hypothetical protein
MTDQTEGTTGSPWDMVFIETSDSELLPHLLQVKAKVEIGDMEYIHTSDVNRADYLNNTDGFQDRVDAELIERLKNMVAAAEAMVGDD